MAGVDSLGLLRFGLLAIVTGVVYRRPIAVQPIKAAAANGYSRFSQLRCIDSDDNIARSDFGYSKMAGQFYSDVVLGCSESRPRDVKTN